MTDLHISWPAYHQQIEKLAALIYQSQWPFNQIVCLARGGLRVGDLLSRIYRQPLAILATASYGGDQGRVREPLILSPTLTMTTPTLGSHVLLVDDLVDSGVTLAQTQAWLHQNYLAEITELRTAVLWYKATSVIAPDYSVDYLADNPWIHQPFEIYEQMNPIDLVQQYAAQMPPQPDPMCK